MPGRRIWFTALLVGMLLIAAASVAQWRRGRDRRQFDTIRGALEVGDAGVIGGKTIIQTAIGISPTDCSS